MKILKNKAEYEAGSTGINVDTSAGAEHKDAGVTPNTGVGAKDDAESTTKATVSEGEIEIRDKEKQKQDLAGLNRDTKTASISWEKSLTRPRSKNVRNWLDFLRDCI